MTPRIKLGWKDLSFSIDTPQGRKTILSDFTGQLESSKLVAILGPSGSGKTTFLNCLTGRCKPTGGSIRFYSKTAEKNWAYVPQNGNMYAYLTVEEYLLCASKFKNCFRSKWQHDEAVQHMQDVFFLEKCAKTLVKNCSGGEIKRLTIALEVISNPDTLFLDEPTTGLDSSTGVSCVQFLRSFVESETAEVSPSILITIHQPNLELFQLLDHVYILSEGVCIYSGAPGRLVEHFKKANLLCEPNSNPADFALNIASRGAQEASVQELHKLYVELKNANPGRELSYSIFVPQASRSFLVTFVAHIKRFVLIDGRDPQRFSMYALLVTFFPLLCVLFAESSMFRTSICIYNPLNATHVKQETPYKVSDRREVSLGGSRILIYNVMFNYFAYAGLGMFSFSPHFNSLKEEQMNKWYSCSSFFVAYLLVIAVNGVLYTSLNCFAILAIAYGIFTPVTFLYYWATSVLVCWFGKSVGLLLGVTFPNSVMVSFGALTVINVVNVLLTDIVVLTEFMAPPLVFFKQFSGLGQLVNVLLTAVYPAALCQVDDLKLFTMQQVVDFVKFYNFRTNSTLDDFDDLTFRAWESMSARLWFKTDIIQLLSSHNNMSAMAVDQLSLFWKTDLNMVVNEYGLGVVHLSKSALISVALTVAYCLLSWCVIRAKMKCSRSFVGTCLNIKPEGTGIDDLS